MFDFFGKRDQQDHQAGKGSSFAGWKSINDLPTDIPTFDLISELIAKDQSGPMTSGEFSAIKKYPPAIVIGVGKTGEYVLRDLLTMVGENLLVQEAVKVILIHSDNASSETHRFYGAVETRIFNLYRKRHLDSRV